MTLPRSADYVAILAGVLSTFPPHNIEHPEKCLPMAQGVFDALGLEQVGWWCSNGQPYLILGPDIHAQDGHTHEPVYRLRGRD